MWVFALRYITENMPDELLTIEREDAVYSLSSSLTTEKKVMSKDDMITFIHHALSLHTFDEEKCDSIQLDFIQFPSVLINSSNVQEAKRYITRMLELAI